MGLAIYFGHISIITTTGGGCDQFKNLRNSYKIYEQKLNYYCFYSFSTCIYTKFESIDFVHRLNSTLFLFLVVENFKQLKPN